MINKIQTVGQASKGVVYIIIGALTAMAAFNMGGETAGKSSVIDFLQQQPFGNFIVYVLGAGILAYALWRFYKAIADPKDKGDDASGFAKRFGYFCSGVIYGTFGYAVISSGGSGGSGGSGQQYAAQLMDKSYGPFLIGLTGIIVICVGIYQAYKGYSGKYLEELNAPQSSNSGLLHTTGKFGYMARGLVFGIIGYFILLAGITTNADMIRSTQGAFSYMQQFSYGWLIMGVVAIGLLGHGIFMIFVAKHSRVRT